MTRPGQLAVRAVNQYRRRDVLTYVGLRYYLESTAARTDQWANEVALNLVQRRTQPSYFMSLHFKDVGDSKGGFQHREMAFPGPNEALAEAALIDACAQKGGPFDPDRRVFSYRPTKGGDRSGIFQHYMHGVKARHAAITEACVRSPQASVAFVDIQRFYPSIKSRIASTSWGFACDEARLPATYRELGAKLIVDHASASGGVHGHLLTGPMFSHLLGNVFLRNVDTALAVAPAQYFRYVDDIALVGSEQEIQVSLHLLQTKLRELELDLHDESSEKSMRISAVDWMHAEHDFSGEVREKSWMRLVGELKQLLTLHPELTQDITEQFGSEGIRIPVPNYSGATHEAGFVERFLSLARQPWYRAQISRVSSRGLVSQALALRNKYADELRQLLDKLSTTDAFGAKRLLPQVRYRLGRLAYLGDADELSSIGEEARKFPPLFFQAEVARAIGSGSIDEIVAMGSNAAQAVAQPLRMGTNKAKLSRQPKSDVELQALAVFALNGIAVEVPGPPNEGNELLKFAVHGSSSELMRSKNVFVSELACLHGISHAPRHIGVLDSAFDEAEEIAMDAIDQARNSLSI